MIRAALYAWNRGALVVVDDGTSPPTITETFAFDDAGAVRFQDLARVISTHDVGRLVCVTSPIFPGPAMALGARLRAAVAMAGIEVITVDDGQRKAHRGQAIKLAPRGTAPEAVRDALALVLADMAGGVSGGDVAGLLPAVVDVSAELMQILAGDDRPEPIVPPEARGDWILHVPPPLGTDPVTVALCGPLPAPTGPRVAGIDPGEHWVAVTVGEGSVAPLRYVASIVVEVERAPKSQPSDEQLDAALAKVIAFCEEHHVERAAIERAVNVHRKPGAAPEEAAGMSAMLLRGQYVAGILRGGLRAALRPGPDGPVHSVPHVESVSSVKGRNHVRRLAGVPSVKGAPWEPAVRSAFGGTLPPTPGPHILDAAVCAVWAVRPAEVGSAPPREAKPPGAPRKRSHASREAKRAAARAAAGCVCKGPRCAPPCPLALRANAARRQAMTGNQNAKA